MRRQRLERIEARTVEILEWAEARREAARVGLDPADVPELVAVTRWIAPKLAPLIAAGATEEEIKRRAAELVEEYERRPWERIGRR